MALICTKIVYKMVYKVVYKVGCIYDTEDNKKSRHDGRLPYKITVYA